MIKGTCFIICGIALLILIPKEIVYILALIGAFTVLGWLTEEPKPPEPLVYEGEKDENGKDLYEDS